MVLNDDGKTQKKSLAEGNDVRVEYNLINNCYDLAK